MLASSDGRRTVPVIVDGENVIVGFLGRSRMTLGIPLFAVG
ncbi:MAG: hypothetical protein A4E70_02423 [Syntrophus sp. PtaU1.Bin005]|jgi:hypothetical protein|nr:MAG: hypothetical protein A4E69_01253 [Syntrophus sp. PtaB.Bin138]OPY78241.1 MAG: hypothetical protein A4E70_02423 [Syntrophus sp. PtaU1.Bin005]